MMDVRTCCVQVYFLDTKDVDLEDLHGFDKVLTYCVIFFMGDTMYIDTMEPYMGGRFGEWYSVTIGNG